MSQSFKLFKVLSKKLKRTKPFNFRFRSSGQSGLATIPLRVLLTVPFVIQLVGAVGLVGYLSYRSGHQSVENLAGRLINNASIRIQERLDELVEIPHTLIQLNQAGVESGELDLKDGARLERLFWQQMNIFESALSIGFASATGELTVVGRDVTGVVTTKGGLLSGEVRQPIPGTRRYYSLGAAGQRINLLNTVDNYDARQRPWYQAAVEAQQSTWSPVFSWQGLEQAAITAVAPVYQNGELQGVLMSDWLLSALSYQLNQIKPTPSIETFIIDRSGKLVATSVQEQPFIKPIDGQPLVQLDAVDSHNLLTRSTTRAVLGRWSNLRMIQTPQSFNFTLDRERQFVRVSPYRDRYGLDWLVVIVVPESDFMAEIKANQRRTVWLCVVTFGLALATGTLTAHWIAVPIRRLQQAADAIAHGQFDTPIPVNGVGEVAQLAEQFQRMAHQLSIFFETAQASEQKFANLLGNLPVGVSVFDTTGQLVYVNQVGQRIAGSSLMQEGTGSSFDQIAAIYPFYLAGTQDPYPVEQLPVKRGLRGETTTIDDLDVEIDGRRIALEVQTIPICDDQGQVIYAINVFQDITERRRAAQLQANYQRDLEQALTQQAAAIRQSEARFQFAVDQMPDVFALYDAERRFQFVNARGLKISGFSLADHLGKRDEDLHPPQVTDAYLPLLKRAIATRSMQTGECTIALPHREPSTIIVTYAPLLDSDGSIQQVMALTYDITPRKRAELALQESEARFRQIAATISQVFLIRDAVSGQFLYVSPAYETIWGRSCESLYQNPESWLEAIYPEDLPRVQQSLQQQFHGQPVKREYRIQRSDGSIRWIQAAISTVRDQQGTVVRYAGIAEDITERKQAEQALQQSEARLKLVTDSLPGCIAYIDASQRYQFVNRIYEQWFNCPTDKIVGRTVGQVLGPAAYRVVQPYIKRVLLGEMVAYEHAIPFPSGETRYVSAVLVPDRDAQDIVQGYYALITDISARRRAELALQETNERQQAILSVMPDLMYVVAADGRVLGQVTFRPERDLFAVNQNVSQMTIFQVGTPEHIAQKVSVLRMALATRKIQIYEQRVEKDGQTWYEEVRCVPMLGQRVLFMFRDISDRKQAEEDLKQSEDRFRKAFDGAPIGMALISPITGQFLRVNRELHHILGYSEAELLQLSFQDITHPDDLTACLEGQQQLLTGQLRQYQTQKRYIHKQGYVVQVLLSSSLVRDQAENPLYLVTHVLDMSDRYRIDQMKDEFISIVSHELRTPLTAIRGSLGILESGVLDDNPDEIKSMLKIASSSSERLVRLVNDILDLERLESGKTELVMQACSVSAVIQDAIGAVSAIADAANVTLSVCQTETDLYAAPDALVQTLTNLLSNAVKFSDSGSTVWLTAEPFEPLPEELSEPRSGILATVPYWLFSVRDRGRGIPPDKQEMIFERFQQIDVSDARMKGGTGLGLTICQTIIRQHGGRIWVQSEVGQGSVFYFTVPCWRKSA